MKVSCKHFVIADVAQGIAALTYNSGYYLERLEQPGLLLRAIHLPNGQSLVPVGGKRRGGHASFSSRKYARRVLRMAMGDPRGFPNPRVIGQGPGWGWRLEWGAPAPTPPPEDCSDDEFVEHHVAVGSYYGYTDRSIVAFINHIMRPIDE